MAQCRSAASIFTCIHLLPERSMAEKGYSTSGSTGTSAQTKLAIWILVRMLCMFSGEIELAVSDTCKWNRVGQGSRMDVTIGPILGMR